MKFDLSLQQYVEWEVKNVMPIKGKYGYRVILKYMDGSERPQQKSGFATEKEANAARDKTIGELYAGTYVVYSNVSVKEFLEFWLEEDIRNRVGSAETYDTYRSIVKNHIIPYWGKRKMTDINRGDVVKLYKEKTEYSPSVPLSSSSNLMVISCPARAAFSSAATKKPKIAPASKMTNE